MLRRVLERSRKSRRRTLLAISSRRMLERLRKSRRRISLAISKFARHAQTRMMKRAGNRWGTRETQNMEKVSQGRPGRKEKWQVWENGSFSRYCRKNAGPEQIAALANSPTQRIRRASCRGIQVLNPRPSNQMTQTKEKVLFD